MNSLFHTIWMKLTKMQNILLKAKNSFIVYFWILSKR